MRKKAAVWVLLFISCNVFGFENFGIKWNIGNLGIGGNIFEDGSNTEGFVDLLNIGIEHRNTRIGLEYSPVKYWSWNHTDTNDITMEEITTETTSWSFLNFNLYWNALDVNFLDDMLRFYLGPFTSVNYMHRTNGAFRWNEFVYTAGLRLGLGFNFTENIYYNILGTEVGYRSLNGRNALYVSVKIDIIVYLFIAVSSSTKDDNK